MGLLPEIHGNSEAGPGPDFPRLWSSDGEEKCARGGGHGAAPRRPPRFCAPIRGGPTPAEETATKGKVRFKEGL